ncbi:MAG: tetraacyldisaccharide 4'-kinase [Flavobacteriales bacterium]
MRWLGLPFTLLLGLVLRLRHLLYDRKIFKSKAATVPTIAIGNLSLGGSGKTPMAEYLIELLAKSYRVAMLSRGYGRQTQGFRWVDVHIL